VLWSRIVLRVVTVEDGMASFVGAGAPDSMANASVECLLLHFCLDFAQWILSYRIL
jgi:hypothetical protein